MSHAGSLTKIDLLKTFQIRLMASPSPYGPFLRSKAKGETSVCIFPNLQLPSHTYQETVHG